MECISIIAGRNGEPTRRRSPNRSITVLSYPRHAGGPRGRGRGPFPTGHWPYVDRPAVGDTWLDGRARMRIDRRGPGPGPCMRVGVSSSCKTWDAMRWMNNAGAATAVLARDSWRARSTAVCARWSPPRMGGSLLWPAPPSRPRMHARAAVPGAGVLHASALGPPSSYG